MAAPLFVERVPVAEVYVWEQEKQAGAGRDRRLGATQGSPGTWQLQEAVDALRPRDLGKWRTWPRSGPRAVTELVQSVVMLGYTMFAYHDFRIRQSGLHPESAVAWEHKLICMTLGFLVSFGRLDVASCAGAEHSASRLLVIERAVMVNPLAPVCSGLHKMIQRSLDEGGGVATRELTSLMAQLAEVDARIMKHNRLLGEEFSKKETDDSRHPQDAAGQKHRAKKKEGRPPETSYATAGGLGTPPPPSGPASSRARASPLPLPTSAGGRSVAGLPRGTAQRIRRREAAARLVGEVAVALDVLDGAPAGRPLRMGSGRANLDTHACSAAQLCVGRRARAAVQMAGPLPPGLSRQRALQQLLHSDDVCQIRSLAAS